ncbi:nuclear transport factor 2 family protein [Luteolibacter arcticus]|uniref:Nuclear transport factor 2 family protein n=1 Tax=Luteolibacter arcticus TaxID=1581411 RepID=A0ABT3GP40_9BACT|nr:nuclear transport factor 2 family protein [Luteolibacter arcticus]MCW1925288.1 nuclear transport factor 2 family protein [Luteolibacter arcticus]
MVRGFKMDLYRVLICAYLAAYEKKDRAALENLLTDDFTFSSPVDDRIDRERYFERCWPFSQRVETFRIEKLLADDEEAFVRYEALTKDGSAFRNLETFTVREGKIQHVEVYFGSDTADSVRESEITALVDSWAEGIRTKDVEAVANFFTDDPVGFYLAPPLQADEPLRENLTEWFATFDGPIGYEVKELAISASGEVAWCHALNHLTGTRTDGERTDLWFRLTLGFKRSGDHWKIAHAHESVPFLMDGSGKASLDLELAKNDD